MKHYIALLLVLVLAACGPMDHSAPRGMVEISPQRMHVEPAQVQPVAPAPTPGEDPAGAVVLVSVEMTHWIVCVDEAKVYSNPGENSDWYLYSLEEGEPVLVRELDHTRTFAAVAVANYVKFTDLCWPDDE